MSVLTDFFTSLANKIRSKTGNSETLTPPQMIDEIDNIYTPTQEKTVTASTSTTTVTPDTGYALSSVTVNPTPSQEKTVTAGTSAASVTPDSGKLLSKVTYNPTPTQTKSASPSTSAQTISPDSGKYLSSVSISAMSPQRSSGTAATLTGVDSTGPYVYFPYGWWPNANSTYGNYTRMTAAQAVTACPKQEKTITSSRSAQTVTPDSGKLLSKVTVNALTPTGTFNASTTRSTAIDMGATNNYRYVNTNSVSNTNSGTYTFAANDTGGTKDMGSTNTYRYVNASNVYNKGYSDGNGAGYSTGYSDGIHYGTDAFLQGLTRNAFWFSINNSCGGNVTTTTVSGQNQVTINSINTGIVVVTNRNTGKFINLLCKYNTYCRVIDDDAGSNQNSGLTVMDATQSGKFILRAASGIDNFFNVWIFNTY